MKIFLLMLAVLVVAAAASAQVVTPALSFVTLNTYRPTDPVTAPYKTQSVVYDPLAFCNKVPTTPPVGTVINPAAIEFVDPDQTHVGKACQINFAAFWAANLIAATGYTARLTYTYVDTVISGVSNATGPFDEQGGHPVPVVTGVR